MRKIFTTQLFMLIGLLLVWGNNAYSHDHKLPNQAIDFIENKGQWNGAIRFKADIPGGAMFLTDKGFVYHFSSKAEHDYLHQTTNTKNPKQQHNQKEETIRHHAYSVSFLGSNKELTYNTNNKRTPYHNYFVGNDASTWLSKVGLYGEVWQRNVYHGIDLKLYSHGHSGIKYDFVVAPGANPAQIALVFEGVTPMLTNEGHLRIQTSVNEIIEKAPFVYQEIDGKRITIKSKYALEHGRLTFQLLEAYNVQHALIIDPDLVFATYSGSTGGAKYAHATSYDNSGNTYTAAYAEDQGWPTTLGAYQTTFPSMTAAINKYTPDGATLLFSTYFGGTSGTCQPNTIRVNDNNEVFLAGCVTAPDMPVAASAFQAFRNGTSDIYIARFSQDGSALLAATYIGGAGLESSLMGTSTVYNQLGSSNYANPTDIALDDVGNVWVTSNSGSSDFPLTANSFQSILAGAHDAVLFKMNASLSSLLYSTYIGGAAWDGGIGVEYNKLNNTVGVVGYTASNNFAALPGAYKPSYSGNVDGFALLINNNSYQMLASTYLGTQGQDIAMRLAFDCNNNFYVAGKTTGNYPVTNTIAQGLVPYGYVFIDKLNPSLSGSIASTRTGAPENDIVVSAMMVDICGNTLLACIGATELTQPGRPLTLDAFQTNPSSFYFVNFAPNFTGLKFGSYFGTMTDHYHPSVSRIDPLGILYHSVCSSTGVFPITPGVYAPVKSNTSLDNITFKFDFETSTIQSNSIAGGGANSPNTHCVRACKPALIQYDIAPSADTQVFKYLLTGDAINGIDYAWLPDSISVLPNQSTAAIEIKGLLPAGSYDPKYVVINMISPCNCAGEEFIISRDTVWIYDSLYVKILTPLDTVCPGEQITIEAEIAPTLNFIWSPAHLIPDVTGLTIQPIVEQNTTYNITVFQPGAPATCPSRTVGYTATIAPFPQIIHPDEIIICLGDSVEIMLNILPEGVPYTYKWSPPDYLQNDNDRMNRFQAPIGQYSKTITVSTLGTNCTDSSELMITVLPPLQFDWVSPVDTTIHYGDSIQLHTASEATMWYWSPASFLDTATVQNPWAKPPKSMVYKVTGLNAYGCQATADVKINVIYKSKLGLPNAFSPNGDGLNDVFGLEQLNFEKILEFKIFNRYGQLVFEAQNAQQAWDGTFQGKPVSTGTYYYLIAVAIPPEGTNKVFKGDVTLIR